MAEGEKNQVQPQTQQTRIVGTSDTIRVNSANMPNVPPSMGMGAPIPQPPMPSNVDAQQLAQHLTKAQQELANTFQELIASVTNLVMSYALCDFDELAKRLKEVDGGEDLLDALKDVVRAMRKIQKVVRKSQRGK